MVDKKPSAIVRYLNRYVMGQDDAKKTLAVAVYAHYRKIALPRADDASIIKSNILLIGPTGTGKTLMCETLSRVARRAVRHRRRDLARADAGYVNEEIEAILQRLLDQADGDAARAEHGIVFIDEIDKLKAVDGEPRSTSGESVQHALLKIMERRDGQAGRRRVPRHHQHPVHLRRRVRRAGGDPVEDARLRLHLDLAGRTTRRSSTASTRVSSRPTSSSSG